MATQLENMLPLHRIDLDTYNRMVDAGALDGRHVELLDGLLVEMSPRSRDHVVVVTRLMRHFASEPRWWTQVQDPIEVEPDCEPEPDLAIAAQMPSQGQHLRTALLVIEVAVSSHQVDRVRKAPLYARAGIPTYWLVDVPGSAVEVSTGPRRDRYEHLEIYREGTCVPSPLEGLEDLDIAALLADVGN